MVTPALKEVKQIEQHYFGKISQYSGGCKAWAAVGVLLAADAETGQTPRRVQREEIFSQL